jgi:hypothetical protein
MTIGETIQPDHIFMGLRIPEKAQLFDLAGHAALAL